MPNHVKNVVKMEGITNLPLFVEEDGKKCFDFNKIILMPESLNIESGSMTDECAMYYLTEKCTIPVGCLDAEKMKTARHTLKIMKNTVVPHGTTGVQNTGVRSGTHIATNRGMKIR